MIINWKGNTVVIGMRIWFTLHCIYIGVKNRQFQLLVYACRG
jgi:hypothetical protein